MQIKHINLIKYLIQIQLSNRFFVNSIFLFIFKSYYKDTIQLFLCMVKQEVGKLTQCNIIIIFYHL